jgi:hypothetical protein
MGRELDAASTGDRIIGSENAERREHADDTPLVPARMTSSTKKRGLPLTFAAVSENGEPGAGNARLRPRAAAKQAGRAYSRRKWSVALKCGTPGAPRAGLSNPSGIWKSLGWSGCPGGQAGHVCDILPRWDRQ